MNDESAVYRVLQVSSVVFDLDDASPVLHLHEAEEPYRALAVPVALADAQAIQAALSNRSGRRPTTHELFAAVLAEARIDVVAARIESVAGGVFQASLDLMTPAGRLVLDARTSDAVTLALRQAVVAPILCRDEVLADLNP